MKNILFVFLFFGSFLGLSAGVPKGVNNAQKALISIVTYNEKGILRSGTGFFINENGEALADYDLFSGAQRADVIDANGKKWEVLRICGANEMFNVVRFRVNAKNVKALEISDVIPSQGTKVYVLPYDVKKKELPVETRLNQISKITNGTYYTLPLSYKDKYISNPIITEDGKVLGMIQKNAIKNDTLSYAIGVDYGKSLAIGPLSSNDAVLKNIGIVKALPADKKDAITYLYFLSQNPADSLRYLIAIDDFNVAYPQSIEGYMEKAQYYAQRKDYENCEKEMQAALSKSDKKDEVHFALSKIIYRKSLYDAKSTYKNWDLNEALKEAEVAYSINPLPVYLMLQGDCFYGLKSYDKALEKYTEVNKTSFASAETFYNAARATEMMGGKTEDILVLLDSAINKYSKPYPLQAAPYLLERGNKYLLLNKYREAVLDYNEYEHLVGYKNLNDRFYYIREQAELEGRMFQQALDDINRAITLNPKEYLYHVERAVIMLRTNQLDEAMASARKSIQLNSQGADGYKVLGVVYGEKGDKVKALENLKKAKELGDETADDLIKTYSK